MNPSMHGTGNFWKNVRTCGLGIFLIASFFYLLCIVLYFYPYFNNFSEALIGPPEDNMQDFWNTWYSQIILDKDPAAFFHTNIIKYPEGTTLYYHSFSYSNLLIIYSARKILSLPVTTPVLVWFHNAMLLLSFYLAGIGAFYLTRRFAKSVPAAFLGGFIFAFSPFHTAHALHHMHVATIQYIPFFVLCFLRFLDTQKPKYLACSILFYFLSVISCWYYLIYTMYFLAFYYIYNAVVQRTFILKRLLSPIFANIVGVMVLLSPLLVPMVLEGLQGGPVYQAGHRCYVADLLGYVVFHPHHLLSGFSAGIYSRFTGNLWELTVYLGLLNVGLFTWAYVNRKRLEIKEMGFLLWGMLVFMLLASGSVLHVLGKPIIMFPTVIFEFVPFLKNVRTPSRAVVFVYLFLGIGVGLAIEAIMDKFSERKGVMFAWLTIISVLIFVDFYPTKIEATKIKCPPAYGVIIQDKDPNFGILDLPTGYVFGNVYMMYQATCHKTPIVTATASRAINTTLADSLEMSDIQKQKEQLASNRVKYIVIHKEYMEDIRECQRVIDSYHVIYSDNNNIVLRVY